MAKVLDEFSDEKLFELTKVGKESRLFRSIIGQNKEEDAQKSNYELY